MYTIVWQRVVQICILLVLRLCARGKANFEDFANCCIYAAKLIGNGNCDPESNNEACGWDGGDCCECTCKGYTCALIPENDAECMDPEAASAKYGCAEWTTALSPCVSQQNRTRMLVETTSQARDLTNALNCAGGVFDVIWSGHVVIDQPTSVSGGTVLNVTGVSSNSIIDAKSTTGLFIVYNASLYVSSMVLVDGNSTTSGGAVAALHSNISLSRTMFIGNVATSYGGAVFLSGGSTLTCGEETNFFNNSAVTRGGAISAIERSHATWTREVTFAYNNAGIGGAMDISLSSSVLWAAGGGATFVGNTADHGGGGLNVFSNSSARWEGTSTFVNNSALDGGGGISV